MNIVNKVKGPSAVHLLLFYVLFFFYVFFFLFSQPYIKMSSLRIRHKLFGESMKFSLYLYFVLEEMFI